MIQFEKCFAVLKLRLRFPFRSPPRSGSLLSPRDSTSSKLNGYIMKQLALILLLFPLLACPVEEQPTVVDDRQLGYSAVFPGRITTARYNESTPFGEIEWFNTSYTAPSGSKFYQNFNIEVGTLPPGDQGGANQREILDTLKEWISWRYPGSIYDLEGDRGPGFEYIHKRSNQTYVHGIIVLRRGRFHHARVTTGNPRDPQLTAFLSSFVVDP